MVAAVALLSSFVASVVGPCGIETPAGAAASPLTLAYVEVSNDLGFSNPQAPNVTASFNDATNTTTVHWGSGQEVGTLTIPGPLEAGEVSSPNLTVSEGDDGCNLNGSPASTYLEVDQFTTSAASIQTLGIQFDCSNQPLNNDISGSIAINIVPTTPHAGYYIYGDDGALAGFANDSYLNYLGDLTTVDLNKPIVGMATTRDGGGYWMAATDGGIFNFGDAGFYGSTGALALNKPIVGMAATPDGGGYWLVASDGGIFAFGDAQFYGSTGALHLNKPIVGMTPTVDGGGYWLVASDGGIFAFGDAQFYGSTGALHLNKPIVGMAATPDGHGYWMVATDGGIFAFGDSQFYGSTGALHLNEPIVGMTPTPDGGGYWLVASDGGIFTFGDATFAGSLGGQGITNVVGITS
jgi:hypothetical protein